MKGEGSDDPSHQDRFLGMNTTLASKMICAFHPESRQYIEKTSSGKTISRCAKCRVERVLKCRRESIKKLKRHFGGKCIKCGYDKCLAALDFHHVDPATKSFGLSADGRYLSFAKMIEEARKCVLICCRCHREEHVDE